jgi:excinuclease ABC subunit C
MDGGKGQVNVALKVMEDVGLEIPICGMVKDDRHRTRGLYFNNIELSISEHSEGFKLITRVQDEAHRFAIEYHRKLRGKAQIKSILDDIEGVGPKRRKDLMMYFKSFEVIKEAPMETLQKVVPKNIAINIYDFFHKEQNK